MNITAFAILVTLFAVTDLSINACAKENSPAYHDGESNSIIHNWELAESYRMGKNGLKKDPKLASHYFIKAMEKINQNLKEVNKDYPMWNKLFLNACAQLEPVMYRADDLDPYAMLEIAQAYWDGVWYGSTFLEDKNRSNKLLKKAHEILRYLAESDDAKALYYLSMIEPYLNNEIVYPFDELGRSQRNSLSSMKDLRASALGGYEPAITKWASVLMGPFIYDGHPLTNIDLLQKIYNIEELMINYKINHPDMPFPDFTGYMKEEAYYWNIKAAVIGDSFAMECVGICYEKGIGVEKNIQRSILWYIYAYRNGSQSAEKKLAKMSKNYFIKHGLSKDMVNQNLELVPIPQSALITCEGK